MKAILFTNFKDKAPNVDVSSIVDAFRKRPDDYSDHVKHRIANFTVIDATEVKKGHTYSGGNYAYNFLKYCELNFDLGIFYVANPSAKVDEKHIATVPLGLWQAYGYWCSRRLRKNSAITHRPDLLPNQVGRKKSERNANAALTVPANHSDSILICEGGLISNEPQQGMLHNSPVDWEQTDSGKRFQETLSRNIGSYLRSIDHAVNPAGDTLNAIASVLGCGREELLSSGYSGSERVCDLKFLSVQLAIHAETVIKVATFLGSLLSACTIAIKEIETLCREADKRRREGKRGETSAATTLSADVGNWHLTQQNFLALQRDFAELVVAYPALGQSAGHTHEHTNSSGSGDGLLDLVSFAVKGAPRDCSLDDRDKQQLAAAFGRFSLHDTTEGDASLLRSSIEQMRTVIHLRLRDARQFDSLVNSPTTHWTSLHQRIQSATEAVIETSASITG